MKALLMLLLAPALWAQEPGTSTLGLGTAPIDLAPPGCRERLLLSLTQGATTPKQKPKASKCRRPVPEATVEVWDFAFQETLTHETFRLFQEQLLLSIRENWRFAPPSHGRIDLAIQAGGAGSDMKMAQSLQQRFNRLPPNGSPVHLGSAR